MEPVEQPSVADVVKTEAARQTVVLVFGIAGTVATVYIAQRLRDADTARYWKMWTALAVKRWADKWAERFDSLSAYAATVYNGEKL